MSSPTQTSNPPWLVMVYMAGDNSLTEEMVLALQDLKAEGPPQDDIIVAQFDPSGTGISTQRYDFTDSIGKVTLDDYRDKTFDGLESNTGSPDTLKAFIKWARDQVTDGIKRRSLLILSGHGSGTTEDFFMKDEASMDALTFDELHDVLKNVKPKIDILGLDACYMCMGELAYEIRGDVGILIGPEGLEPAFGWPYRRILAGAKAKRLAPGGQPMAPEELADTIVSEYVSHYADYDRAAGRSADLAALRLAEMNAVTRAFKALVAQLDALPDADHDKILLAHWYAQTYKADQFVDLRDLCVQIQTQLGQDHPAASACEGVKSALDASVIRSGCSGFAT